MVAFICLVIFLVFSSTESAGLDRPKLIIDHDGGADDAMAIFMALLCEKHFDGPQVIALTTTHGNVDEEQVFNNTQRILTLAGRRDIPIYRGSAKSLGISKPPGDYFGKDGLGDNYTDYEPIAAQKEHAVWGLIELSKIYEGELTVITLGPLTNIALAKRIDPQFLSRLSQIYVAAGHIYSKNFKEPEFNARMDIEAYHIVVENGPADKITAIPSSQIRTYLELSKNWRQKVFGSIDTEIVRALNVFERISFNASSVWCHLDPSAMAIVLKPSIVQVYLHSKNNIILCGDQRGLNTNNFTAIDEANIRVTYIVKREEYQHLLYELFVADLQN